MYAGNLAVQRGLDARRVCFPLEGPSKFTGFLGSQGLDCLSSNIVEARVMSNAFPLGADDNYSI